MASFELEFEVRCNECNADLITDENTRISARGGVGILNVQPCSTCLDDAKNEVHELVSERDARIKELEEELERLQ
jgi:hypothetical protein